MMDGQVAAIRSALDDNGSVNTAILAYAAKYASALYGPFRDAVDVTIAGGGDRRDYPQDPPNPRQAPSEVAPAHAAGAGLVLGNAPPSSLHAIPAPPAPLAIPHAALNA